MAKPTVAQREAHRLQKISDSARARITTLDWKVQRHIEQRELVAAGGLEATALTEAEYIELLEEKQVLRDSILHPTALVR